MVGTICPASAYQARSSETTTRRPSRPFLSDASFTNFRFPDDAAGPTSPEKERQSARRRDRCETGKAALPRLQAPDILKIGLRLVIGRSRQRLTAERALHFLARERPRRTGESPLGARRDQLARGVDIFTGAGRPGHGNLAIHDRNGGLRKGRTDRQRGRDTD